MAVVAAFATASHLNVIESTALPVADRMDPTHLLYPGQAPGAVAGGPASAASGRAGGAGATGNDSPAKSAKSVRSVRSAKASPSTSASPARSAGRSSGRSRRSGHSGGHRTLTCSGTTGMLPANYAAIVQFLTEHGYTALAAAGIAGNIYQESKGDPESVGSGGGGLIGWTPLPAGFVTGNPAADLRTQLAAVLSYNQQWSAYIPALNAATSAADAADIYMNYFERPGIPAASNREAAAEAVAAACGL